MEKHVYGGGVGVLGATLALRLQKWRFSISIFSDLQPPDVLLALSEVLKVGLKKRDTSSLPENSP